MAKPIPTTDLMPKWVPLHHPGEFHSVSGTNGKDVIDIAAKVGTKNMKNSGEHHAFGHGGNDEITGDMYSINCLFGGRGNDTITGGNKVDILYGDVREGQAYGTDTTYNDTLFGLGGRDLLRGGLGNDRLFGGDGADRIYGGAGNDLIVGGAGGDVIDGGEGIDTVSFAVYAEDDPSTENIMTGVMVDLSAGTTGAMFLMDENGDPVSSFENVSNRKGLREFVDLYPLTSNQTNHAGDNLLNIENVIGTIFQDMLMGDENANVLEGGAGGDELSGGEGSDTASYKNSEKFVVVFLSNNNDMFPSTGAGFKIISGGNPAELIVDFTPMGATPKTGFFVSITKESVIENNVVLSTSFRIAEINTMTMPYSDAHGDLLEGIENLEGSAHDDVLGGDLGSNFLDGGAGNDHLYGGAGDDELQGGAGADRLYGGDDSDWASYASAEKGSVVVNGVVVNGVGVVASLGDSAINQGDAFGDTYDSIENIRGSGYDDLLTGDGNDNKIEGLSGGDVIRGGNGTDVIDGGEGNDFLYGEGGKDVLNGGEGNDVLYGNAERDLLDGEDGVDSLYGGDGDDNLDGGIGNDFLYGEAGDDTLNGGVGKDSLYGGAGTNILKGGGGEDHYYLDIKGSWGMITDGEGDNKIYFISNDIDKNDFTFIKKMQSQDLEITVSDPDIESNSFLYQVTIRDYYETVESTTINDGFSIYHGTGTNPDAHAVDVILSQ